jgi:hypothetical protein
MATTTKDQARDLAKKFRELSNDLGKYRFDNWGDLTLKQRTEIEDTEWTLLNHSSDFITTAVGIGFDDVADSLQQISKATGKAKKVISKITTIKSILKVAAALVVLGGAIASKNPETIISAAADLFETSQTILKA